MGMKVFTFGMVITAMWIILINLNAFAFDIEDNQTFFYKTVEFKTYEEDPSILPYIKKVSNVLSDEIKECQEYEKTRKEEKRSSIKCTTLIAPIDFDNDGKNELIVILHHLYTCGSLGCSAYLYTEKKDGTYLVFHLPNTNIAPIKVFKSKDRKITIADISDQYKIMYKNCKYVYMIDLGKHIYKKGYLK